MHNCVNNPGRPIHSNRKMKSFLLSCWNVFHEQPNAYVVIASFDRDEDRMYHQYIRVRYLSRDLRGILSPLSQTNRDIYFCPNAFRNPKPTKHNVIATPYLHADIDNADPNSFKPMPNILWETSPGRYQGLWSMSTAIDADLAQKNSKRLAYAHGADKNGHAPNKLLRVPGSVNMKPRYGYPEVRIIRDNWALKYSNQELLLDLSPLRLEIIRNPTLLPVQSDFSQVMKIWGKYQPKLYKTDIGKRAAIFMKHRAVYRTTDRSGTIYAIIAGLHSVGASKQEIASVLISNPYFIAKHGSNLTTLSKEISRCVANWENSKNG